MQGFQIGHQLTMQKYAVTKLVLVPHHSQAELLA